MYGSALPHPVLSLQGPFGLIICPSRELARQTYDSVVDYCESLHKCHRAPWVAMGDCESFHQYRRQLAPIRASAAHDAMHCMHRVAWDSLQERLVLTGSCIQEWIPPAATHAVHWWY